jgi:hypothetical protein
MTTYALGFKDAAGRDLDIWEDYLSLSYGRKLNSLGRLTVEMPVRSGINPATIRRDYHLIVNRKIGEMPQYLDMDTWWLIDRVDWDIASQTVKIEAGDLLHVLKKKIVDYTDDTPYANKTAVVFDFESLALLSTADMIRDFVDENLSSAALDVTRDLAVMSVQANDGLGPTGEVNGTFRNLLEVCQEIATQSDALDYPFYFDIVSTGEAAFEFKVFTRTRGTDRSSISISPLYFSADENLSDVHLIWDYREEKTFLRITGEGAGSSILRDTFQDDSRNYSIWGKIEEYITLGSDAGAASYFERKGKEILHGKRPKLQLTADVTDAPGSVYGLDYVYGSRVGAYVEGFEFDCVIDSVQISISDGKEKISSSLKGEITL